MTGFCGSQIHNYAQIAYSLFLLKQKKQTLLLVEKQHQESFEKPRDILVDSIVLKHNNPQAPLRVFRDASSNNSSVALFQQNIVTGEWIAIGFYNRKFSDTENKRDTMGQRIMLDYIYTLFFIIYY